MIQASLPKGTRDFMPSQLLKRKYMFGIIESVFVNYGYKPIETPAMENLSSLTGQYGEEGDKLLFKVLNNGDYLAKADGKAMAEKNSSALLPTISKRGLRYDLTVPFARFIVQHNNEINYPFKRYAIQPVWRADRPQKGRYQEFYQCDVDVVGSDSLLYESELVCIYDEVFDKLGLEVEILVNNRKLLQGIANRAGVGSNFTAFAVTIDKLDKIGNEGVKKEFRENGFAESTIKRIFELLDFSNIDELKTELRDTPAGMEGIFEMEQFYSFLEKIKLKNRLKLDTSLARGMGYYTGCIFEVKALNTNIGSVGGGGRYDNLTNMFGLSGISGVGISFGAERIFDIMEEASMFDNLHLNPTKAIFLSFDKLSLVRSFEAATLLRKEGLSVDIYPEPAKFKKQMKYASDNKYPYVIIVGEEERQSEKYTLKDMISGEQQKLNIHSILTLLQKV